MLRMVSLGKVNESASREVMRRKMGRRGRRGMKEDDRGWDRSGGNLNFKSVRGCGK